MARIVPDDYPTDLIINKSERAVVEALMEVSDAWFVIPNVEFNDRKRPREIDVVLLHPVLGLVTIEVKGYLPRVRQGKWIDEHGSLVYPQPYQQAKDNAYGLLNELKSHVTGINHQRIPWAVAFPRAEEMEGRLPDGLEDFNIVLSTDLENRDLLEDKLERLATSTYLVEGFSEDTVNNIISHLAPDADFTWDAVGEHRRARRRLHQLSDQQVEALVTLEDNPRVVVRGRAGTGKTRLARQWTRNAVRQREERVLLTCYNDPLGQYFQDEFDGWDEVWAGPFLRVIGDLPGVPPLHEPVAANYPDADEFRRAVTRWWNDDLPAHVLAHVDEIQVGFDMIVVDEAQDFTPLWMDVLEALLDPDGPMRMLLLGDDMQDIYQRGSILPGVEDGWVTASMPRNCRNAHVIASLLRRTLNGAAPALAAPPGWGCRFVTSDGLDATVAAVVQTVATWLAEGRNPHSIAVVTTGSTLRDRLRESLSSGSATGGLTGGVLVETAHRIKGLEFDSVVLAVETETPRDELLYVGASRAVSELVMVAPPVAMERFGSMLP